MTPLEIVLTKQLGYIAFTMYSYIKTNKTSRNKEITYNLGLSDQSRNRSINKLKSHNIIRVHGATNDREFEILPESKWKL